MTQFFAIFAIFAIQFSKKFGANGEKWRKWRLAPPHIFKLLNINIQGLAPEDGVSRQWKLDLLQDIVDSSKNPVPFIALTETWAKSYTTDAQLQIKDYSIFRADRSSRRCGGVATYVHDSLTVSEHHSFDNKFCECSVVLIQSEKTMLVNMYRPPLCPKKYFSPALSFVKNHVNNKADDWTVTITGDFNFPTINWEDLVIEPGLGSECRESAELLLDFAAESFITQYVNVSTRKDNILDLVFTSDPNLVKHVSSVETKMSDHNIVTIFMEGNLSSYCKSAGRAQTDKFSFRNLKVHDCDYDEVNGKLKEVNWDLLKNECTMEEFPVLFELIVLQLMCMTAAAKSDGKAGHHKDKIRFPIMRRRRKLNARLQALVRHNPSSPNIQRLKDKISMIELQLKKISTSRMRKEEAKAVAAIKSNPKYFYSFAKRQKSCKSRIGPLLVDKEEFTSDATVMANMFQKQYSSVFSDSNNPNKKVPEDKACPTSIEQFDVTPESIRNAIDELKEDSSPGEDGFPAIVLKRCKESLCYPLYLMWKDSAETGFIHEMLKSQLISPVHKKSSKAVPANYRPVSLTSHIIKVFE